MVRDDLQACLQAYQFADLLLGGFSSKSPQERQEALKGAERLRSDVEPRYDAAQASKAYDARQLAALGEARARLEQKLTEARKLPDVPASG